ncbi:MAG: DUF2088 domain-containing protein [Phycisphaerae bacterium]|nr:DUF2088 domain-containing protein [Phycisphaerae bacterium]
MKLSLHYGQGRVELIIPQANLAGFIQPRHQATPSDGRQLLLQAIEPCRRQLASRTQGRCVGILLPDGTRDLPHQEILPLLLEPLGRARKLLFFICTGTHPGNTPANQEILRTIAACSMNLPARWEVIVHDCQDASFQSAGLTKRGTDVLYNSRLDEAEIILCLSDIKHHYFAGYSNPIKNIVPGLCSFSVAEQNHRWTLDARSRAGFHPWHPCAGRQENPLACDMLEAAERIVRDRPFWALAVISSRKVIQWADLGLAQQVCARAFQRADEWNVHTVEQTHYMVVSPGGLPNDVDLYIAQRALELTHSAAADGGHILFLAACPDGIGSPQTRDQFERPLTEPLESILNRRPSEYRLFSHKPYRLAMLIRRLSRLWMHTEIDSATVRAIHMEPCTDPQQVIDDWLVQEPTAQILAVDGANKLLLECRTI